MQGVDSSFFGRPPPGRRGGGAAVFVLHALRVRVSHSSCSAQDMPTTVVVPVGTGKKEVGSSSSDRGTGTTFDR